LARPDRGTPLATRCMSDRTFVNATQKLDPGLSREDARTVCRSLSAVSCEPVTDETIAKAWSVQDRFGLSWWDSLIVASALLAGCSRLVTEDLQDALQIDGLKVVNPFVKRSPTI
jgi:predicted nucleic acid-binding protein